MKSVFRFFSLIIASMFFSLLIGFSQGVGAQITYTTTLYHQLVGSTTWDFQSNYTSTESQDDADAKCEAGKKIWETQKNGSFKCE